MPLLNFCCCCCSLRTGGVILGALGIIRSLLGIAISALVLISLDQVISMSKEEGKTLIDEKRNEFGNNFTLTSDDFNDTADIMHLVFKIILGIFLVVCIVDLVCAVLLIIASKKDRKEFVLPYLITDGIGIILTTLFFVLSAFNSQNPVQGILSALISFGIAGYLWLCVLSLYQLLKEQERPPAVIRTAYPEQQAVYSSMA